ncbi:hypothetical protein KL919_004508 [Ogataea angusta]|nr:hypothetical protein KL943_004360 [Ogataea angusta]KAG7856115.1 hypothetical protein KL919_004508 [Ogataea angusta]
MDYDPALQQLNLEADDPSPLRSKFKSESVSSSFKHLPSAQSMASPTTNYSARPSSSQSGSSMDLVGSAKPNGLDKSFHGLSLTRQSATASSIWSANTSPAGSNVWNSSVSQRQSPKTIPHEARTLSEGARKDHRADDYATSPLQYGHSIPEDSNNNLWNDLSNEISTAVNSPELLGLNPPEPRQLSLNGSSQQWDPLSQSTGSLVSPGFWASTGSLDDTPLSHRMSRFFPSPAVESRKDSNGAVLGERRSHSTGFPASPLTLSLFAPENAKTSGGSLYGPVSSMATPLGGTTPLSASRNSSYVDQLFDGFSLGTLQTSSNDIKKLKTLGKDEPATELVVRRIDEDALISSIAEEVSLPPRFPKQTFNKQDSHSKVIKYIKTIITRQPTQYMVYVASLPFDTPHSQCLALIHQAFKDYGEITHLIKDTNAKSSKIQPENDLFIRFKIVAKLFNEQKLPYKSHRFSNESTGRDSKMLLFFDCPSSSPQGELGGSSSTAKRQEISTYPEGFSSTFHRRGVNNFMFVRELQSKMITSKGRGTRNFQETAEFRVSLPIEELDLKMGESDAERYDDDYRRPKRSYVVNIDLRELENKPAPKEGRKYSRSGRSREKSAT